MDSEGASAKEKNGLEDTGKNVSSSAIEKDGMEDTGKNGESDAIAIVKNNCSQLGTVDCPAIHTELQEPRGSHIYNAGEGNIVSLGLSCTKEMRPTDECQLPKEVVETILAMIPFPDLLKVPALSKTWHKKFPLPSEISSRLDPKLPLLKKSDFFKKLVSSASWRWSVYSPVIVSDHGSLGYDAVDKLWQGLGANLQQVLGGSLEPWLTSSRGPLICGVSQSPDSHSDLFMTDVLTKNCRKLRSHPNHRTPSLLNVVFDAPNSYKVSIVTEDPFDGPYDNWETNDFNPQSHRSVTSQLFDSRNGSWTVSQSNIPTAPSFARGSCSMYIDGLFYCLSGDDRKLIDYPLQLWVHEPEEGSWLEIRYPFEHCVNVFSGSSVLVDLTRFQLVVCGSKIMIVVALDPETNSKEWVAANSLHIFELDPEMRVVTLKSSGPPATVLGNSEHITSDVFNIYFCTLDLQICCPVVVYNVKSGEWSCLAPDFKTSKPLTNK